MDKIFYLPRPGGQQRAGVVVLDHRDACWRGWEQTLSALSLRIFLRQGNTHGAKSQLKVVLLLLILFVYYMFSWRQIIVLIRYNCSFIDSKDYL